MSQLPAVGTSAFLAGFESQYLDSVARMTTGHGRSSSNPWVDFPFVALRSASNYGGSFQERVRRGRRTSSPSQLGHLWMSSLPHVAQKVHSKLQMTASPSSKREPSHRSQTDRISNIAFPPWTKDYQRSFGLRLISFEAKHKNPRSAESSVRHSSEAPDPPIMTIRLPAKESLMPSG